MHKKERSALWLNAMHSGKKPVKGDEFENSPYLIYSLKS